jgi:hypothetical protein
MQAKIMSTLNQLRASTGLLLPAREEWQSGRRSSRDQGVKDLIIENVSLMVPRASTVFAGIPRLPGLVRFHII